MFTDITPLASLTRMSSRNISFNGLWSNISWGHYTQTWRLLLGYHSFFLVLAGNQSTLQHHPGKNVLWAQTRILHSTKILSGQQLNLPSLSGQWRFGHSRTYTLCHHLRMDLLSNQSMISSLSSMVRIHFLANQTCYHLCVGMGPVMDCTFFDALKLNGHSCNQRSHSSFGKTWLFHLPLLINRGHCIAQHLNCKADFLHWI